MTDWQQKLDNVMKKWNEKRQEKANKTLTQQTAIDNFINNKAKPALEMFGEQLKRYGREYHVECTGFPNSDLLRQVSINVKFEEETEFSQTISAKYTGTGLQTVMSPPEKIMGNVNDDNAESIVRKYLVDLYESAINSRLDE